MSALPRLRCAVYTRKSTEDGLEQEFNSLDAQREACEAYVVSQASLGWRLLPDRYDDGGISGGTMERPALQRLLADLRDRKVDVVVVYKIDRLTRSLSDFARIVDIFDAAGASFVSVTQQFNTTTSMGRLTLNVLLSFAQFEREVTAERIRDKIAASKRKGMWMGGGVPFGYRAENKKLRIDAAEAGIVRHLFERYLELQSVRALLAEANALRIPAMKTGRRERKDETGGAVGDVGSRNGKDPARHQHVDGVPAVAKPQSPVRTFTRGHLYHLLSNPIYIGKVRHKGVIHQGEHEAIVGSEIFAEVQRLLATQAPARRSSGNATDLHLLTGLLHDEEGNSLRSVHTRKGDVRYRYYVSKALVEERGKSGQGGWRLPANEIEKVVEAELSNLLGDHRQLADLLRHHIAADRLPIIIHEASKLLSAYRQSPPQQRRETIRRLVARIDLAPAMMVVRVDKTGLANALGCPADEAHPGTCASGDIHGIACPIALRRRGKETKIILIDRSRRAAVPDPTLLRLVRQSHHYLAQLTDGSGRSISDIAEANCVDRSDVGRALRLAFLAPTIVDQIVAGTQPADLTAHKLSRLPELPLSWSAQEMLLGR